LTSRTFKNFLAVDVGGGDVVVADVDDVGIDVRLKSQKLIPKIPVNRTYILI